MLYILILQPVHYPVQKKESVQETALSLQYVELEVKPGDTLLSLIESQGGYPDDVSIEEMIKDFSALNEGIKPDDMQFGETYKIPVYNQKNINPLLFACSKPLSHLLFH